MPEVRRAGGAGFVPPAPGVGLPGSGPPAAVGWLKGYFAAQLLMFGGLSLIALGLVATAAIDPSFRVNPDDPPAWVIGILLAAYALPLAVAYLVGLVAPRKPWVYVYRLVACAGSFVCGGCWFLALPVLVYWMKSETKAWYSAA